MIRVILEILPDPLPDHIIGNNTVLVEGVEKPALYFENHNIDLAASLGGEMLVTE